MLDFGVDLDVWPWIWLGIAVVFALIELTVLGGSFVLLPFAVSAFFACLLGFADVAVEVQWAVFVFGGAALFVLFYRFAKRFIGQNELAPGVGADRLVGLVGIVTVDIDPDDTSRHGRVTVEGETWGALPVGGVGRFAEGSKVRIVAMQGTRVIVAPLTDTAPGTSPPPSGPPTAPPGGPS